MWRDLGAAYRVSLIVGAILSILMWPSGVAEAAVITDNMVPTATYSYPCNKGSVDSGDFLCQTDNAGLTWFAKTGGTYAISEFDRASIGYVAESDFDAKTDLTVTLDSTPAYTGSAETDIIYRQGDVPGSDTGTTWCDDPVDSDLYKCDQQYIQIEQSQFSHGLICHETGHAVGLTHGNQAYPVVGNNNPDLDCMQKPTPIGQVLGANSIYNINHQY